MPEASAYGSGITEFGTTEFINCVDFCRRSFILKAKEYHTVMRLFFTVDFLRRSPCRL